MNTLLIQLRKDKTARDHELDCFSNKSGISKDEITQLDILEESQANLHLLEGMDALVVGGSGDFLISEGDIPEKISLVEKFMSEARSKNLPTLGICFGAQIMAQVYGGKLTKDVERQELGTFEIKKHETAELCPIFQDLPENFHVQLGHKDHITKLPSGAVNLAYSERSEVQSFTFPGESIYGFTFHPELSKEDVYWRLSHYVKDYEMTPEALADLQSRTFDAEYGTRPLELFYKHIVGGKKIYQA